eukprot:CAMPEP_0170732936 /NCGR_PEP_ID=MMETSP0437-20130122/1814_1 /TAXON_ID=0 /ORGANISM="Sexangularia sp." /LENGTH=180 /DNA_ID=CAMNT_0011071199 /DNA_START=87 /DNA_END=629 /DNA_ORIENTATION=+
MSDEKVEVKTEEKVEKKDEVSETKETPETKEEDDNGPDFAPVVTLPEVETSNAEEDEDVIFKMRAKLFRFDFETNEWKERGVGNVRFLKHKESKKVRLLMRREKVLKVCANHYLIPAMKLEANAGSDRSWLYTCPADFSDDEPKKELLAIRFANAEDAAEFKKKFEECQKENEALMAKEE